MAAALARRLPPRVLVAGLDPAEAEVGRLFPEEQAAVERAVDRRAREFAAGRLAARELLGRLGHAPAPLLPGTDRAPSWPAGVRGSITHTDGLCLVAVAPAAAVGGLGIDAEPREPLGEDLWRLVLTPAERERIAAASPGQRALLARLLFSAKEAVYKAQHPLTGAFLEHAHVEVTLGAGPTGFRADVQHAAAARLGPLQGLVLDAGRWWVTALAL